MDTQLRYKFRRASALLPGSEISENLKQAAGGAYAWVKRWKVDVDSGLSLFDAIRDLSDNCTDNQLRVLVIIASLNDPVSFSEMFEQWLDDAVRMVNEAASSGDPIKKFFCRGAWHEGKAIQPTPEERAAEIRSKTRSRGGRDVI